MKLAKLKVVLVDWEDSSTIHGWVSPDQMQSIALSRTPVLTLGFLLEQNEAGYLIAHMVGPEEQASTVSWIPRNIVKRVKILAKVDRPDYEINLEP